MNADRDRREDFDVIDRILATEEELVPSSGFASAVMDRVREEAAAPAPIPFPWRRAVPGIVLTAGVLGWGAWQAVRYALPQARQVLLRPPALSPIAAHRLQAVGWVACALAVSLCSWILSVRLVRRSGLL